MRLTSLFAISMLFGSVLAACSGDDGGGGGNVDAPKVIDAPMIDAPPAITMLGKTCLVAMSGADCPADFGCLGPLVAGGTTGFCTKECIAAGTFMTDAQSVPQNITPDPATLDGMCAPLYTGSPGAGICGQFFARMPTGALTANTNYTFKAACVLEATNGMCPAGTTIQAGTMFCYPN